MLPEHCAVMDSLRLPPDHGALLHQLPSPQQTPHPLARRHQYHKDSKSSITHRESIGALAVTNMCRIQFIWRKQLNVLILFEEFCAMFNLPHVTSQCNCSTRMSALGAALVLLCFRRNIWFHYVPPGAVKVQTKMATTPL